MVEWSIVKRFLKAFPGSFINDNLEFIAEKRMNQYICLEKCKNEFEIKCKVLESFSRAACKTEYYQSQRKNDELHDFMLNGINEFLDTDFTKYNMCKIYEYLGNGINHELTKRFVSSGYDMNLLEEDV